MENSLLDIFPSSALKLGNNKQLGTGKLD